MTQRRLAPTKQPQYATEAFKKVSEILKAGALVFPEEGKYNGPGAPGRYLEDLLGIDENNADSPDLADWEIKFQGGATLLNLFHKDLEPKGMGFAMRNHGTKFRIINDDLSRVCINTIKITTGLGQLSI